MFLKSTLEEINILCLQLSMVSKLEYLTVYLSVLLSCLDYQAKINGKEITLEGSHNKYSL